MTGHDLGPFAWWRLIVALGAMTVVGGGALLLIRYLVDAK